MSLAPSAQLPQVVLLLFSKTLDSGTLHSFKRVNILSLAALQGGDHPEQLLNVEGSVLLQLQEPLAVLLVGILQQALVITDLPLKNRRVRILRHYNELL